ncbi:MAG: EAL domain-containing protein, partial [Spirochaetota bacterium]
MSGEKHSKLEQRILKLEKTLQRISSYLEEFKTKKGDENGFAGVKTGKGEAQAVDTLATVDREGIIISAEIPFLDIFGKDPDQVLNRNIIELFPDYMQAFFSERWDRLISGFINQGQKSEESIKINGLHRKGYEIPLDIAILSYNTDGSETFKIRLRDVSYRREIEEELLASRENYKILAETATDAIVQIDNEFKILFANSAVKKIFGYDSREVENKKINMLFPPSRYEKYEIQFKKYFFIDETHRILSGLKNSIEVLGRRKNGDVLPLEISFGNSKGVQNNRILTCIIRDIALRKKAERRLKYLAYHDKLTSLGNRDRLNDSLDQVIAEIKRQKYRHAALLFLDLDGFKKVNDSLGHEMGDRILKECARRLSNCLREDDQVYRFQMEDIFRLGGDEFTLLLPHIRKTEDAAVVARRIIEKILEPFTIEGYGSLSNVGMGVSVGIALIPEDGMDKTTLLRNADAAMYTAKEFGNTYVFFTKEMNNKAVDRLMYEDGLRKSLSNNEFELYYQPIVDSTGKTGGMEALLRWIHPQKGIIHPDKFIEIAEDTRLIMPLGEWVLETALRHLKYWRNMGWRDLYVSVNVSPKQLEKGDLNKVVNDILKRVGLSSELLTLELTETCIMKDAESAIEKMHRLKDENSGLKIAIDDFGTGYSSLSYLSRFPA